MTVMPLAEITDRAIGLLKREMGVADTIRFLNQFRTGAGAYTEERDALLGDVTLEQIVDDIKSHRV
ncbi:MAG TPA: hypothetical protein VFH27_01635 [Longimicrobiaceae bacterium]|nr:hypothetical protein [Longimicrobiaceae bacterium]